ncbi:MAG: sugar phosphate isomerase/epimerase [Planctomycetaceae bacterium]|nr:sugar phosphate isomerase/epimerase [Planctomycetaceae bacterium]
MRRRRRSCRDLNVSRKSVAFPVSADTKLLRPPFTACDLMLPKFALAAAPFDRSLRELLRIAGSLGAKGLQFNSKTELRPNQFSETGRRQFLHEMDEHGLSVSSLVFPTRRAFYDQDELEARIAACRQVMQFAWQVRSKVVVLRVGRLPEDANAKEYGVLREVLNDLAAYGNHVGVTLTITPSRDSSAALRTLMDAVTSGPIAVNFDPVPFLLSGEKPEAAFRVLHDRIGHLTVRDALQDIDGAGIEVPVGRGETRWDELLALAEESAYRGWWSIDRTQGDDRGGDVARALSYIQTIALGG